MREYAMAARTQVPKESIDRDRFTCFAYALRIERRSDYDALVEEYDYGALATAGIIEELISRGEVCPGATRTFTPKDVVPYYDGDKLTHAARVTKANERMMQRLDRTRSTSITSLMCHRRTGTLLAATSLYL
jgi:hypothetical protein